MAINIHATLVSLNGKGILLTGKSGSGKSDLALRMIMEYQEQLVADDRVDLVLKNGKVYGSAPETISGKLEIRNVGIGNFPAAKEAEITLCAELCTDKKELERLPLPDTVDLLGVSVTKLKLYPFECSTVYKIITKISGIIS